MKIEPRPQRFVKSFRISQEAIDIIEQLADAYQANQGRVLEALLQTYGKKDLEKMGATNE